MNGSVDHIRNWVIDNNLTMSIKPFEESRSYPEEVFNFVIKEDVVTSYDTYRAGEHFSLCGYELELYLSVVLKDVWDECQKFEGGVIPKVKNVLGVRWWRPIKMSNLQKRG